MDIQIATLDNLKKYTELLQKTYQEAYVNKEISLTVDCFSKEIFENDDTQKYLRSHLSNSEKQKTWLAFEGDLLIGAVTCILVHNDKAELTGFYVHPNHQGKGIGSKLYELVLGFAKNRDLMLDIYLHNTKAIKIYRKWGWELDYNRGSNGYFNRHWPEWPKDLSVECMYMILKNNKLKKNE